MSQSRDVLAANVRTLRAIRRLGQQELAGRIGVSRRTIARIEAAQIADPGVDLVRALARALGVELEQLVAEELVAVTLPVPARVRDRLDSPEGARALARFFSEL